MHNLPTCDREYDTLNKMASSAAIDVPHLKTEEEEAAALLADPAAEPPLPQAPQHEPQADHLVLVVPGIGDQFQLIKDGRGAFDSPLERLEGRLNQMRTAYSFLAGRHPDLNRVAFRQADWHSVLRQHGTLASTQEEIRRVTCSGSRAVRDRLVNDTLLDVLYYMSPLSHDSILQAAARTLNAAYADYLEQFPSFRY